MPLRSLRRLKLLLEFEPKFRAVVQSRKQFQLEAAVKISTVLKQQVEPESKVQLTTKTA